eukprot:CAMPEP_0179026728 /NCGR_PEP_ID=MMETSP0796-20121207/8667_1 /TAXON_ID=73915 /ORGANISM="Pyrodinium bahamense, Strain pbaha01" /LENGTH=339 /DNA_ID=CAMNT_0020722823 /DNA_START=16 /DNA_END=1035 /DNA_ORIENTATION=-
MNSGDLGVLTLNVWFDQKLREARTEALVAVIKSIPLGVCCLQEVVPEVAQILTQSLPGWSSSDPGDGSSVEPYGVMTLVAPGLPAEFTFHNLETNMWRRLLVCNLGGMLVVGNVHLESLSNQPLREMQLRACSDVLGPLPNALLVGDFNFDSQRNFKAPHVPLDNVALAKCLHGFVDVWPALRADRGCTFNSQVNPYIAQEEAMRYDRVMAQLSSWRPSSIELMGHEPVDHLVQLTEREQEILKRPPTPPRPQPQPRAPLWEEFDIEKRPLGQLPPATVAESQPSEGSTGVPAPPGPVGDFESPRTPRKERGRLFLSDHFGVLVSLTQHGCGNMDASAS